MLDMGFIHDIRATVGKLPPPRQTLFFSATMPREIAELAKGMLRDPVRVAVAPEATTAEKVDQRIIHIDRAGKPALLVEVLRQETIDRALVFTRTKHGADKVVRALEKAGLPAEAIHGNKSQGQRERVLAACRAGKVRTLVATDIAARGIDVDGISHVVNYDLPNIPESYVHRIGRTARAGAEGIAISFCDGEERAYLRDIEKLIRMSIPATDRRGERRPAAEPQPDHAANGSHAANGKPPRRQNRRHQGRPQEGRPQHERPQQQQKQHGRHRDAPSNARPQHQQGRTDDLNGWMPVRNGQASPAGQPGGEAKDISTIAFMKQPKRGGHRRGAPAHHRAPR
jgi:ATP-dependent RNA helicase RhlE